MKAIALSTKLILCQLLLLIALPSHAVVITSGCANATSCSLSELYAGGSIAINDVVFDNWSFNFADGDPIDASDVMISGIDESLSTNPGESTVGLNVLFNPSLLVEFIEYDFDFRTSILGSSRLLIGSALELTDSTNNGDGYVEINNALSNGRLLSVDTGGSNSDTVSFAGLSTLISDSDIQMETFDNNPVGLREFNYAFTVMGSTTSVPEPGALALLLASILVMRPLSTVKKQTKA